MYVDAIISRELQASLGYPDCFFSARHYHLQYKHPCTLQVTIPCIKKVVWLHTIVMSRTNA